MSERITSVSEEELNGYVDGQLSPERRAAVERYLAANPDAARRIATDTFHKQALHAAFTGYSTQPQPPDLVLSRLLEERLQRQSHWWWQIQRRLSSLGVGGVGGWLLHTPSTPDRNTLAMTALEDQALASHAVYSPDRRHPIEVTAAERDHLAQWLTNRLNRTIAAPDLADFGYRLIGGRLLATEQGSPAASLCMRIQLVTVCRWSCDLWRPTCKSPLRNGIVRTLTPAPGSTRGLGMRSLGRSRIPNLTAWRARSAASRVNDQALLDPSETGCARQRSASEAEIVPAACERTARRLVWRFCAFRC